MPEEKKPISDEDVGKFAKLLISMSTDFLMKGINKATFIHNLRVMADTLALSAYPPMPTDISREQLIKNLTSDELRCDSDITHVIHLLESMSDDEIGYFESRHRAKQTEQKG